MNREMRRQRAARLLEENRAWSHVPAEVPRSAWPEPMPPGIQAVFRSRAFLVQVYAVGTPGVVCRLTVSRTFVERDGDWSGGITWDELQTLKAQVGYADRWAVEVFPPVGEAVNVASMRHLWVLTDAPAYAWRQPTAAGGLAA